MATPGDLIRTMAEALGLPQATVFNHDRYLAVAGLRTQGGRGSSAARMTARDAAYLLTAILASAQAKDAAGTIARYQVTCPFAAHSSPKAYAPLGLAELSRLPARHSFLEALEALIASTATGALAALLDREAALHGVDRHAVAPIIEVAALIPGTVGDIRLAGIKGKTAHLRYAPPSPAVTSRTRQPGSTRKSGGAAPTTAAGLEQYRRVTAAVILQLADVLTPQKGDPA